MPCWPSLGLRVRETERGKKNKLSVFSPSGFWPPALSPIRTLSRLPQKTERERQPGGDSGSMKVAEPAIHQEEEEQRLKSNCYRDERDREGKTEGNWQNTCLALPSFHAHSSARALNGAQTAFVAALGDAFESAYGPGTVSARGGFHYTCDCIMMRVLFNQEGYS